MLRGIIVVVHLDFGMIHLSREGGATIPKVRVCR